ncbi:hypothetical protein HRbin36_00063 [bacterium HR36]|nr:hypothetical protein HRbin36_00063 [bacterium HR36]
MLATTAQTDLNHRAVENNRPVYFSVPRERVVIKQDERGPDSPLCVVQSALLSSLVGLLASAGPYAAHNWRAGLLLAPLILTTAAIVEVWFATLFRDTSN